VQVGHTACQNGMCRRSQHRRTMNTTETADGTATIGSAKCACASMKPSAALCMPAQKHVQRASAERRLDHVPGDACGCRNWSNLSFEEESIAKIDWPHDVPKLCAR